MPKTTEQVVREHLTERIERLEAAVQSARSCLVVDAFLQCAVRLQDAEPLVRFDTLYLNICDTLEKGDRNAK